MELSIAASISSLVSQVKQEYCLRPAGFLVIEEYNQQIQGIFDNALSNDAFICWHTARDQSGNIVNLIKYSDDSAQLRDKAFLLVIFLLGLVSAVNMRYIIENETYNEYHSTMIIY